MGHEWYCNSILAVAFLLLIQYDIDPRDGIFTYTDPITNDILLESVEDGKTEVFVQATDLVSTLINSTYPHLNIIAI